MMRRLLVAAGVVSWVAAVLVADTLPWVAAVLVAPVTGWALLDLWQIHTAPRPPRDVDTIQAHRDALDAIARHAHPSSFDREDVA
jgi:hypothetical protein